MIERMTRAYEDEKERWIMRDATWLKESQSYEVCRFDDSGFAGSFDEVRRHKHSDEAKADLDKVLATRPIIAALKAAREPGDEFVRFGQHYGNWAIPEHFTEFWQAMIDQAIKEGGDPDR